MLERVDRVDGAGQLVPPARARPDARARRDRGARGCPGRWWRRCGACGTTGRWGRRPWSAPPPRVPSPPPAGGGARRIDHAAAPTPAAMATGATSGNRMSAMAATAVAPPVARYPARCRLSSSRSAASRSSCAASSSSPTAWETPSAARPPRLIDSCSRRRPESMAFCAAPQTVSWSPRASRTTDGCDGSGRREVARRREPRRRARRGGPRLARAWPRARPAPPARARASTPTRRACARRGARGRRTRRWPA